MEAILSCHPALFHRMTGLGGNFVWTMTQSHRCHWFSGVCFTSHDAPSQSVIPDHDISTPVSLSHVRCCCHPFPIIPQGKKAFTSQRMAARGASLSMWPSVITSWRAWVPSPTAAQWHRQNIFVAVHVQNFYRKVVYKSRGSMCNFSTFWCSFYSSAAFIWGGLYAKSWVCKTRKSGLQHKKWKWNLTLRFVPHYFKCKQTFGMRKAGGVSPTSTTLGRFFSAAASIRVRLMCNLSSEKLRLLFECGF